MQKKLDEKEPQFSSVEHPRADSCDRVAKGGESSILELRVLGGDGADMFRSDTLSTPGNNGRHKLRGLRGDRREPVRDEVGSCSCGGLCKTLSVLGHLGGTGLHLDW